MPGGNRTVPPPAAFAAAIARLIASESSVLPSPVAPKALTSNTPAAAALLPAAWPCPVGPHASIATAITPSHGRADLVRGLVACMGSDAASRILPGRVIAEDRCSRRRWARRAAGWTWRGRGLGRSTRTMPRRPSCPASPRRPAPCPPIPPTWDCRRTSCR